MDILSLNSPVTMTDDDTGLVEIWLSGKYFLSSGYTFNFRIEVRSDDSLRGVESGRRVFGDGPRHLSTSWMALGRMFRIFLDGYHVNADQVLLSSIGRNRYGGQIREYTVPGLYKGLRAWLGAGEVSSKENPFVIQAPDKGLPVMTRVQKEG